MVSKRLLCLIAGVALPLTASEQNTLSTAPVPRDPLEMATGQIRPVAGRAQRAEALRLLARARDAYALRSARRGYDLKVSFTVNSGGQTEYDGTWDMEDIFDPAQGLRWTAKASAGYLITRISANGMLYSEETASYVPLRLQEARAALFDPIPSARNSAQAAVRTTRAVFNGTSLTCILSSTSGRAANQAGGRLWEETEDCIDPKSGLLRVHSQVPGRYYAYDYAGSVQLAGHVMPRKVTVTEAGRTVTEISVDSMTELPAADPALFVPTDAMKARGQATVLGPEQKISTAVPMSQTGAAPHAICVFGLVTAEGEFVEAHSLQPSDPDSQVAVEAARQMNFAVTPLPGAKPEQHFAFVIEKAAGSR